MRIDANSVYRRIPVIKLLRRLIEVGPLVRHIRIGRTVASANGTDVSQNVYIDDDHQNRYVYVGVN
jgi:hypothetical protein